MLQVMYCHDDAIVCMAVDGTQFYLLYLYKSTDSDTEGGGRQLRLHRLRRRVDPHMEYVGGGTSETPSLLAFLVQKYKC